MATPVEVSSALQFWTAIVAGNATAAAAIGGILTNVSLVVTSRFESTNSPPLGASSSTGAAATISADVVGESVDVSPLPVQSNTPPGILIVWNVNMKVHPHLWPSGNDLELYARAPGFDPLQFRRRAVARLSSRDLSRFSFGHTRYIKIHVLPQGSHRERAGGSIPHNL